MAHWADSYVGLLPDGDFPCWQLLRLVWIEQAGVFLPRFDSTDNPIRAMRSLADEHAEIAVADAVALDAVTMEIPVRDGNGWAVIEGHIGVIVSPGLVLHVERNHTSVIEPIKRLRVLRCFKGPFHE